ncbi:MAG: flagellar biosynthesis anti-sigma factor FlgM [Planctomycetaceae bacterium]|nr:flagellar biosynthesis anti-sigma factor FlgM [Planctomycetaceae bacterium]|tara:strand:+ start:3916 stop:4212 length:297 start_codon:yes stop_codon:yes gene_type:complete
MQINGINGAQPVNPANQVESAKATQATSITNPTDQVDISAEAELNSQTVDMVNQLQIQDLPEIRTDRVAQIREAIEDGTYETQDKVDIAIDRLLDEIG